jgi:hypothetical protein
MATNNATNRTNENLTISGNTISSTNAGGDIVLTGNTTGVVEIGANATHASTLRFKEATGSGVNYISFAAAAALGGDQSYTYPSAAPTADGQIWSSTAAGVITWIDPAKATRLITQALHGLSVGNVLYLNSTTYTLADASAASTAEVVGIIVSVPTVNTFVMQFGGFVEGLAGLTAGSVYYLSETAGALTATAPVVPGAVIKPLLVADTTTSGYWTNLLGVVI